MNKLIGITGFARSGKDTAYQRSKILLEKDGHKCFRFAFADELKRESDPFLLKHTGISAFTEDAREKEIIRPFLVTYGTEIRRKLDQNCWIKTVQDRVIEKLNEGYFVFITDVRFKNEAQWVKMNGGLLINVSRENIKPANHDEHKQHHFIKGMVNYNIFWETFGDGEISSCDEHLIPALSHIIQSRPAVEQLM